MQSMCKLSENICVDYYSKFFIKTAKLKNGRMQVDLRMLTSENPCFFQFKIKNYFSYGIL